MSNENNARVNGTLALITCDTLANYGDLLDKRIKDALGRSSRKVYTGDAINYFLSLVANNINSLLIVDPSEVTNAFQAIVSGILSSYGVVNAEWTEGWQYVILK